MDIRHLKYFAATVDAGTVSGAARRLRVSQPSLSRQIHDLEAELGVRLFEHERGRLYVSAAGRQLLPLVEEVLALMQRVKRSAKELASSRLMEIVIAAPVTTLTDVVAPFLSTLASNDPTPSVVECTMDDSVKQLLLDVDLCVTSVSQIDGIEREHIATFPLYAYARPEHVPAGCESIELKEIAKGPLIVPSVRSKSRRVLLGALEAAGLSMPRPIETSNGRIAQALAAAGRGIAVVTDDQVFDLPPMQIHSNGQTLQVHLYGCWRGSHHAAQELRQMSLRLRQFCVEKYGHKVLGE